MRVANSPITQLLAVTIGICLFVPGASAKWFSNGSSVSAASADDAVIGKQTAEDNVMVSPVLNREIETSVIAHDWPTSPQNIFCEAFAYLFPANESDDDGSNDDGRNTSSSSRPMEYLSDLTMRVLSKENNTPASKILTYIDAINLALEATTLKPLQRNLLHYSLALRAGSPFCELHRSLAREAIHHTYANEMQKPLLKDDSSALVAVIYPERTATVISDNNIEATIRTLLEQTKSDSSMSLDAINSILLPGETMPIDTEATTKSILILYGNMGTRSFAEAFQFLTEKSEFKHYIFRHLGDVYYEEKRKLGLLETISAVALQGYGVRLDIRNVEYKVFDDRSDGKSDVANNGLLNVTTIDDDSEMLTTKNEFLAGINLTAINGKEGHEFEKNLWKIHDKHQVLSQIIPPVWQRRRLPLQAAAAIVASKDPLVTLQEISQNLPSVASTLVHLKVPGDIHDVAKSMEDSSPRMQSGILYINGKGFVVDRPSFNMFELLNAIKVEQYFVEYISSTIGPYLQNADGTLSIDALKSVHHAWMMGSDFVATVSVDDNQQAVTLDGMDDDDDDDNNAAKDDQVYRIDVGRGWKQAIIYLNDVEKDGQYRGWGRSVQQFVMGMQFGMASTLRRNMYTIFAVIDPLQKKPNLSISLGGQLMQMQYPARIGVLVVSDDDVVACSKWLSENNSADDVACPVSPLISNIKMTLDDLRSVDASTQAVHRLVAIAMRELATKHGAFSSYFQYLVSSISDTDDDTLSMYDLLKIHGSLFESMNVMDEDEAMEAALKLMKEEVDINDEETPTYGKALRFAIDKGVKVGAGFLNGRSLPTREEDADKLNKIFSEETNHVFRLIMSGEITDYSPKSVYAKVLTGDRVFQRNHPLLSQTSGVYSQPLAGIDKATFHKSTTVPSFSDANFLVDSYFAFDTMEGVDLTRKLVATLDGFSPTISQSGKGVTNIGLSYRVLPSTASAAASPLCKILLSPNSYGDSVAKLKAILNAYAEVLSTNDAASTDNDMVVDTILKNAGVDPMDANEKSEAHEACSNVQFPTLEKKNSIFANGRVFEIDGSSIGKEDFDLLFSVELKRSKAVSKLLKPHFTFTNPSDSERIAATAAFLALSETATSMDRLYTGEIISSMLHGGSNPLRFSWNTETTNTNDLPVEVAILLNPVTEVAQRVAPILLVIRDQLKLPLHVVLTPPTEIDADTKIPITSYYRLVADPAALPDTSSPKALFSYLPSNHVLTIRVDVPEPWNIQQTTTVQDTDNLVCDIRNGCSDETAGGKADLKSPIHKQHQKTMVQYGLKNLIIAGQCYETAGTSPNGLQLQLSRNLARGLTSLSDGKVEVGADGVLSFKNTSTDEIKPYADTLVMKTAGYWQVRANPGVWSLSIAGDSKGAEIFELADGTVKGGRIVERKNSKLNSGKKLVMKDFVSHSELLLVKRREGYEKASLFNMEDNATTFDSSQDVINVFSLATGHLYERFLKIMMLSVTKRTSSRVKFWLFENYLSPGFKSSTKAMAERIGCDVEYVTYKWPEWLRGQTEKQRIIWGYKILFLDVLFPLDVKKIIYVDADQVIRGDLKELWDLDLKGAPYGYTPFCTSRESTLGYQFWREGFWKTHLRGKPYHISALYVVDLERFRKTLVGDQLRATYQQLSADPNSLSNLDQDLPNYAQHQVPIFSLPQEWLWCESWCSDETKSTAKTIDLCNNPEHKEPKVSMAKRIISGNLFNESWIELDAEVEGYELDYIASQTPKNVA